MNCYHAAARAGADKTSGELLFDSLGGKAGSYGNLLVFLDPELSRNRLE